MLLLPSLTATGVTKLYFFLVNLSPFDFSDKKNLYLNPDLSHAVLLLDYSVTAAVTGNNRSVFQGKGVEFLNLYFSLIFTARGIIQHELQCAGKLLINAIKASLHLDNLFTFMKCSAGWTLHSFFFFYV